MTGQPQQLPGHVPTTERTGISLTTKIARGHLRPGDVDQSCKASQERLRQDHVDLLLIQRSRADAKATGRRLIGPPWPPDWEAGSR